MISRKLMNVLILAACSAFIFTGCGEKAAGTWTGQNLTKEPAESASGDGVSGEGNENAGNRPNINPNEEQASFGDASLKTSGSGGQYSISEKDLPFYVYDEKLTEGGTLPVFYINGSVVPYIQVSDIPELLTVVQNGDMSYDCKIDGSGNHVIITRNDTPYDADIDFEKDTITFKDYDAFLKPDGQALVDVGHPISSAEEIFRQVDELSNDRYGRVMCFEFEPYHIDLVRNGRDYYIPLQTLSDVFYSYNNAFTLYNGKGVYAAGYLDFSKDSELFDSYYSATGEITKDLAEFSYNELCFALDNFYGLKEIHDIKKFDTFLDDVGLKEDLKGTDPIKAEAALYELLHCYFDDLHSSFGATSYMSDANEVSKKVEGLNGSWSFNYELNEQEFANERKAAYPNGVPSYEEIGNTAYITFDEFTDLKPDFNYQTEPKEEELDDTIRLMQYSCKQILRDNSPIKNVVIDLSLNSGGDCSAGAYVIGTFLGYGQLSAKNMTTGAATTSIYEIDTNWDGKFDDNDTLAGKGLHLYCLISPVSFSCGNLVPNAYKSSPNVTLIGQTSGGGSCTLNPFTTATGTFFYISGNRRMSVFKNGSFYDIDRGADPDFFISHVEDYYDRKALNDYINKIY